MKRYYLTEKLVKNRPLMEIEESHKVTSRLLSEKKKYEMRLDNLPPIFAVLGMSAVIAIFAKFDFYGSYGSVLTTVALIILLLVVIAIATVMQSIYEIKLDDIKAALKEEREHRSILWDCYYYWEIHSQLYGELH